MFISVLTVFRNPSCSNGMMLYKFFISSFYIYVCGHVCMVCVCVYAEYLRCVVVYLYLCIFSILLHLLWEGILVPVPVPCCTLTWCYFSHVCSVSRWERHCEALCRARRAEEGALHVNQDGLAVTACLSWRGSYDEEFLQSWPPQGTTEFCIFYLPSSQTVRAEQLASL